MKAYGDITDEDFDRILGDLIEYEGKNLLTIEGIYNIVAEYFNNDILEEYKKENSHYLGYEEVLDMFTEGKTKEEVRKDFNYDDVALREHFHVFTDDLCKRNEISDYAYHNWDNPF